MCTRSMTPQSHLGKEAVRQIFENKIKKIPLKRYLNLNSGFEIYLRPNYYESDEEEERNCGRRTRRHSISVPRLVEEEEELDVSDENNLREKRQRRYSDGESESAISVYKRSDEESDTEKQSTNSQRKKVNNKRGGDDLDSLYITRTLTYTSKKQIIQLYQREHINVDVPQNKAVSKQKYDDVHKNIWSSKSDNETFKNNAITSKNLLTDNKKRNKKRTSNLLQTPKCGSRNKGSLTTKSNFLAQLGLEQGEFEEKINQHKRSNMPVLQKLNKVTHTSINGDTAKENHIKYKKKIHREDSNEKKVLRIKNRSTSKSSKSKENKSVHTDTKLNTKENESTSRNSSLKSIKHKSRTSKKQNVKTLNTESINNASELKIDKVIIKYKNNELLQEKTHSCQSDNQKYKNTLNKAHELKNMTEKLCKNNSTKSNKSSPKNVIEEPCKNNDYEQQNKNHEFNTNVVNNKNVESEGEASSHNKKGDESNLSTENINNGTQNKKQSHYNMDELERKLRLLFGEEENVTIGEKTKPEIKELEQKQKKDCVTKKVPSMKTCLEKDKYLNKSSSHNILKKKIVTRAKNKVKRLKGKIQALCKAKLFLEKTFQRNLDPREKSSNSSDDVEKLGEHKSVIKKIQNIMKKNSCFFKEQPTDKVQNSKDECTVHSEKSILMESEFNSDNQKEVLNSNEPEINLTEIKRTDVSDSPLQIESVNIIKDCCCCSPPVPGKSLIEKQVKDQYVNLESDSETEEKVSLLSSLPSILDNMPKESKSEIISLCEKDCCCFMQTGIERFSPKKKNTNSEGNMETSTECDLVLHGNLNVGADVENVESVSEEKTTKTDLSTDIISLDDSIDETEISLSEEENTTSITEVTESETPSELNAVVTADIDGSGTTSQAPVEDMFPEEQEDDPDFHTLIDCLTDALNTDSSPSSCSEAGRESTPIANLQASSVPEDVPLAMNEMEHYKKRLIQQHERPETVSSPYTTTEEDDDNLAEVPLSPASSGQSREDSQEKRKDEVVQKVVRKRAVCRSQFRHQNMEIFKLGNSIPTSLCKTKEPYNVCTEKNLQMCHQNGISKKCDKNTTKVSETITNTTESSKSKDVPLWRSVSLNNEISDNQTTSSNDNNNNTESRNLGSGRHILPAIVPELPERRKHRVKSLPESSGKNLIESSKIDNIAVQKNVNVEVPMENIGNKPVNNRQPISTETAIQPKTIALETPPNGTTSTQNQQKTVLITNNFPETENICISTPIQQKTVSPEIQNSNITTQIQRKTVLNTNNFPETQNTPQSSNQQKSVLKTNNFLKSQNSYKPTQDQQKTVLDTKDLPESQNIHISAQIQQKTVLNPDDFSEAQNSHKPTQLQQKTILDKQAKIQQKAVLNTNNLPEIQSSHEPTQLQQKTILDSNNYRDTLNIYKPTKIQQKAVINVNNFPEIQNSHKSTQIQQKSLLNTNDSPEAQNMGKSTRIQQKTVSNVTDFPEIQNNHGSSSQIQIVKGANWQNVKTTSAVRRKSACLDSDSFCIPINLSMRNSEGINIQRTNTEPCIAHIQRSEVNNNPHLTYTIPKQPNNIPKKPPQLQNQNIVNTRLDSNLVEQNVNDAMTTIPNSILDSQQKNKTVDDFPRIQQQISRMEHPGITSPGAVESQQVSIEMLNSTIMSHIKIVKSFVESAFIVDSISILNHLYITLSSCLSLPSVSNIMKLCIEDGLESIRSYFLVNFFQVPRTPKIMDFIHKMLLLKLRPHTEFLSSSIDLIRQKIKYDYFMEHLLKVLSRNPQENLTIGSPDDVRRPLGEFPNIHHNYPVYPPQQYFPNQNQPYMPNYPPSTISWMENLAYPNGVMPQRDLGNVPLVQTQSRSQPQFQDSNINLGTNMRMPENFSRPNTAMMRPDLYLGDNRCIPPNNGQEAFFVNTPTQARAPRGRPRNSTRPSKTANRLNDNSALWLQMQKEKTLLDQHHIAEHREKYHESIISNDISTSRKVLRRNSDVSVHRGVIEENVLFNNRSRLVDERQLAEKPLGVHTMIENTEENVVPNDFQIFADKPLHPELRESNQNNIDLHSSLARHIAYTATAAPAKNGNINISNSNQTLNAAETNRNNLGINNLQFIMPPNGNAVMNNEQNLNFQPNVDRVIQNPPKFISNDTVINKSRVPDIEQYLQTNIIVNKNQPAHVERESVLQNLFPKKNKEDKTSNIDKTENKQERVGNVNKTGEKFEKENYKIRTSGWLSLNSKISENKNDAKNKSRKHESPHFKFGKSNEHLKTNSVPEVVSSTVIIEDKSMEISKDDISRSANIESFSVQKNADLDDVVLEKISPHGILQNTISYSSVFNEKSSINEEINYIDKKVIGGGIAERMVLETDVSIEKVSDNIDKPPKLIKLSDLKRKVSQDNNKPKKKKVKSDLSYTEIKDEVIIIDDGDKEEETEKLDHNQNDISTGDNTTEKIIDLAIEDNISSEKFSTNRDTASKIEMNRKNNTAVTSKPIIKPIIEDISSDEEIFEQPQLHNISENKVQVDSRKIREDPRKIREDPRKFREDRRKTCEDPRIRVSPKEGGKIQPFQNIDKEISEKPVYATTLPPWTLGKPESKQCKIEEKDNKRKCLEELDQFKENGDNLTCSLKVENNSQLEYPKSMDVKRFTPNSPYSTLEKISPTQSPNIYSPSFKPPIRPVPLSPIVVPMSPAIITPPIVPAPPLGNESIINWGHWLSEEQKKGVFNFERSVSIESSRGSEQSIEVPASISSANNYCLKYPTDEPYCEIKIDSKMYKIKKSLLGKVPKGKLCYIRETNRLIRYFDDNQMELFIQNLNLPEGSTKASDPLKQVRGHADSSSDVEMSTEPCQMSGKGEVLLLTQNVTFSTDDFLSDPEQYVDEIEKVQRYVPKDFYGFYKFVTGYQIVNHHPPISFQTFLTMHNTNGIRGLFKNYLNNLVEERDSA